MDFDESLRVRARAATRSWPARSGGDVAENVRAAGELEQVVHESTPHCVDVPQRAGLAAEQQTDFGFGRPATSERISSRSRSIRSAIAFASARAADTLPTAGWSCAVGESGVRVAEVPDLRAVQPRHQIGL